MTDRARRHEVEQQRPNDFRNTIESLEEDPDLERCVHRRFDS
jgi:hypothetical protein